MQLLQPAVHVLNLPQPRSPPRLRLSSGTSHCSKRQNHTCLCLCLANCLSVCSSPPLACLLPFSLVHSFSKRTEQERLPLLLLQRIALNTARLVHVLRCSAAQRGTADRVSRWSPTRSTHDDERRQQHNHTTQPAHLDKVVHGRVEHPLVASQLIQSRRTRLLQLQLRVFAQLQMGHGRERGRGEQGKVGEWEV